MSSFNFEKTRRKNFKCDGELPLPSLIKTSFTYLSSVMMGPRKLGPTSGVGQFLARHVCQSVEEWSGIDHQDVLMCPRQYSEGDERSNIDDSNNRAGPREVDPKPHTSY